MHGKPGDFCIRFEKESFTNLQKVFTLVITEGIVLLQGNTPSGIKNFNPGFFGTGFPNIFDHGILLKSFGIFWDFHFCFICLSNRIIFINIYHHHQPNHHHYHCHSSSPFIEIIISDCVERASLLYVAFYVLSQSAVKIMHLPHQSQLKCVFKVSLLNVLC